MSAYAGKQPLVDAWLILKADVQKEIFIGKQLLKVDIQINY